MKGAPLVYFHFASEFSQYHLQVKLFLSGWGVMFPPHVTINPCQFFSRLNDCLHCYHFMMCDDFRYPGLTHWICLANCIYSVLQVYPRVTSSYHSEHLSSLRSPSLSWVAFLYKSYFSHHETCLPKVDATTHFSSSSSNFSIGKALPIKSKLNFGLKKGNTREYVSKKLILWQKRWWRHLSWRAAGQSVWDPGSGAAGARTCSGTVPCCGLGAPQAVWPLVPTLWFS